MTRTKPLPEPVTCKHKMQLVRSPLGGHINFVVCRRCFVGMDFAEYHEKKERKEI